MRRKQRTTPQPQPQPEVVAPPTAVSAPAHPVMFDPQACAVAWLTSVSDDTGLLPFTLRDANWYRATRAGWIPLDEDDLRAGLTAYGQQHHQFGQHRGRRDATWRAVVAEVRTLAAAADLDAVPLDRFGRAPQSWHTRDRDRYLPGNPVDSARQYVAERWYPSPGRDLGGRQLAYFHGRWHRWDGAQWVVPTSPTVRPGEYTDPIGDDIAEWIDGAHVWDGDQLVPWRVAFDLDNLIGAVREVCAVPVGIDDGKPDTPIGVCEYDQKQAHREATNSRTSRPLRLNGGDRG